MKDPCIRSRLIQGGLACGLAASAWLIGRTIRRVLRGTPGNGGGRDVSKMSGGRESARSGTGGHGPAGRLNDSAAVLALSVLADSAMEHYRGCFHNPVMFVPLITSALALGESGAAALSGKERGDRGRTALFGASMLIGVAGLGFHFYNIGKREGRFSWNNFFYGAPIGAPGALSLAGLIGLAAEQVNGAALIKIPGLPPGRLLAGISAFGILGTVAEALLYHFRGAFQDPIQYVPVAVPPLAAAALIAAAVRPGADIMKIAGTGLKIISLVGMLGVGFHAYGIHRNMGGWRNWSQMVLQGPPLPAPLGFTGASLAGLAALDLLGRKEGRA